MGNSLSNIDARDGLNADCCDSDANGVTNAAEIGTSQVGGNDNCAETLNGSAKRLHSKTESPQSADKQISTADESHDGPSGSPCKILKPADGMRRSGSERAADSKPARISSLKEDVLKISPDNFDDRTPILDIHLNPAYVQKSAVPKESIIPIGEASKNLIVTTQRDTNGGEMEDGDSIRVWSVEGTEVGVHTVLKRVGKCRGMTLSSDGSRLAAIITIDNGNGTHQLVVWDTNDMTCISQAIFPKHYRFSYPSKAQVIAFSPGLDSVVCDYGQCVVWDITASTATVVYFFDHPSPDQYPFFTCPQGANFAVKDNCYSRLKVLDVKTGTLVATIVSVREADHVSVGLNSIVVVKRQRRSAQWDLVVSYIDLNDGWDQRLESASPGSHDFHSYTGGSAGQQRRCVKNLVPLLVQSQDCDLQFMELCSNDTKVWGVFKNSMIHCWDMPSGALRYVISDYRCDMKFPLKMIDCCVPPLSNWVAVTSGRPQDAPTAPLTLKMFQLESGCETMTLTVPTSINNSEVRSISFQDTVVLM